MRPGTTFAFGLLSAFLLCSTANTVGMAQEIQQDDLKSLMKDYERPKTIKFPENAPYSPQIATLGKMLFFDPRLSGAQNMSCSSCHNPSFGWETPVDKAIGALNVPLERHAPTIVNLADAPWLFWDGRASSLEEQAAGPITHPKEMGSNFPDLIKRLSDIKDYRYWFNKLFPSQGLNRETILTALATYERTVQTGYAPFDRWIAGEESAISDAAKRGFKLFNGKMECANCHSGWNFTNHQLYDIGLATNDLGRANFINEDANSMYKFKTPGLRNISTRAPYMHNGALADLQSVLDHYATGGINRPSLDFTKPDGGISSDEKADLIAFLETLTEENQHVATPSLPSE